MILIKNLSKDFKIGGETVKALQKVNLSIEDGEFVSLVGPSGSGKTTLLNLIGGLEQPTEGSIIIDQKDIAKLKDSQLSRFRAINLGFIFQTFNLLPRFSVHKNVMLPAILAGKNPVKSKAQATEVLKEVGLEDKLKYFPNKLSGGERQRVAIARALINNPGILLADEPTGNLDEKNAEKIMQLLIDLSRKHGKTLILVTHNMELAQKADRIIYLKNGSLVKGSL